MKESRASGREGFRTGGIHEGRGSRLRGLREGRDTGKGGKEEMRVQELCETGEMLDRRDTGKVECR